MSKLKVAALQGLSASSDAITLANDGTCTANITNNLSNRRLTINGDMRIAQRGTSTTAEGYLIDRFQGLYGSVDENPTFAQADVASGTTPYTLGFRKSLKVTNGNQTSGAGAADVIGIRHSIEAQDVANSGWNYKSTSSFVTLSFWVKASVAQNYYGYILSVDGTMQTFPFETGSLSADTWTKVTVKIPGAANVDFTNDNGEGFRIEWRPFTGTDETASGVALNTWAAFASGTRMPDNTSTWYTTNDATFELTGVQLEVGSHSTSYEFKSYAQELALCQRYYYKIKIDTSDSQDSVSIGTGHQNGAYGVVTCQNPVPMRTKPSITVPTVTDAYSFYYKGTVNRSNTISLSGNATDTRIELSHTNFSGDDGAAGVMRITNTSAYIEVHSEL